MSRRRWGLVFGCLAIAVLSLGAIQMIQRAMGPTPSPNEQLLWSTLYTQWVWVLVALAGASLLPGSIPFRLGFRRGRLGLGAIVLAALGLLCLSNAANLLLLDLGVRETGTLARIDRIVGEARGAAPWLAVVAVGLAPGFGEEILFRGLIQRTLAMRLHPAAAVGLAAAFFGLVHLDPAHTPAAFALGLYLGTVGVLAGNVWAPVFCHAANNTLAVATGLSATVIPGVGSTGSAATWAVISLALLAATFWLGQRRASADLAPRGGPDPRGDP